MVLSFWRKKDKKNQGIALPLSTCGYYVFSFTVMAAIEAQKYSQWPLHFRPILPCPYYVATTLLPHNLEDTVLSTSIEILCYPIDLKCYSKIQSLRFRFVFCDDNVVVLGTRTPNQQSSICKEAEPISTILSLRVIVKEPNFNSIFWFPDHAFYIEKIY